jgi:phosphoglycolate phosphatase
MISPERLRLAVFDLDGTLIDSAAAIVEAIRACWSACGFPDVEPDRVRRVIGLPWEDSVPLLMPGSGKRELELIRAYYDDIAHGRRTAPPRDVVPFPGAHDALAALEADDVLLAIVTSRGNHRVHEILERCGFAGQFVTVKTVDHGPGKPNPYLLREAMSEAGARPGETVMVGDTTYDILMAVNAGTASVGVSWGVHEAQELIGAGARRVVDRFEEIPPALRALVGDG